MTNYGRPVSFFMSGGGRLGRGWLLETREEGVEGRATDRHNGENRPPPLVKSRGRIPRASTLVLLEADNDRGRHPLAAGDVGGCCLPRLPRCRRRTAEDGCQDAAGAVPPHRRGGGPNGRGVLALRGGPPQAVAGRRPQRRAPPRRGRRGQARLLAPRFRKPPAAGHHERPSPLCRGSEPPCGCSTHSPASPSSPAWRRLSRPSRRGRPPPPRQPCTHCEPLHRRRGRRRRGQRRPWACARG